MALLEPWHELLLERGICLQWGRKRAENGWDKERDGQTKDETNKPAEEVRIDFFALSRATPDRWLTDRGERTNTHTDTQTISVVSVLITFSHLYARMKRSNRSMSKIKREKCLCVIRENESISNELHDSIIVLRILTLSESDFIFCIFYVAHLACGRKLETLICSPEHF